MKKSACQLEMSLHLRGRGEVKGRFVSLLAIGFEGRAVHNVAQGELGR